MFTIKTEYDIKKMREISHITAKVLKKVASMVTPGMTTEYLDDFTVSYAREFNAVSSCLNYCGYPKNICTSVNHVACHGIPSYKVILKKGDIINIDIALTKDGYHGDTSMMVFVGGSTNCSIIANRIVNIAEECLFKGIDAVKPGNSLYDIAYAIENHAIKNNLFVSDMFCGHGIGKKLHEKPEILPYVPKDLKSLSKLKNTILVPGMTFTIEPIINVGTKNLSILQDNWTAVTTDRSLSAQWEHTLLVVSQGVEILTMR